MTVSVDPASKGDAAPPGFAVAQWNIPSNKPLIAVDLDDVLSETNQSVANWHNDAYGTDMTLSDFYYYYYWRNPYWGTPSETMRKVEEYYATSRLYEASPVEGAIQGVRSLKDLGFLLVIITARQPRELENTEKWLDKHFPGIFETVICTGMSQETLADERVLATKLSKAQSNFGLKVCKTLGAKLMIDDSLENSLKCMRSDPPQPVLLFGDYQWNKREANYSHIEDESSYEERVKKEGGNDFLITDVTTIPSGRWLTRVKDWTEVVQWVKDNLIT
ncbi:uncharacterized protein FIBRA_02350 [Fibroporia radiculosa]|uniref:Swiss Army Knife RNA repair protein HAD domain-containing protein n=1 Tax=Fibroporia radiculosa TaxID=599839 RepID=J4GMT5_9APHY|nr:uncharacterized protein FIBRA_02350 [Fibroporia radiculosa]CCM00320.1 predicted protein [Fibroporia radiculosa]